MSETKSGGFAERSQFNNVDSTFSPLAFTNERLGSTNSVRDVLLGESRVNPRFSQATQESSYDFE
jgi:hypothetical protein